MEVSEETSCASGFEGEEKPVVYLHITPTSPSASTDVWCQYEWRTRKESCSCHAVYDYVEGGSFDEQYGSKENRIILRLSFIFLRFFACLLYVVAAATAAGACLPLSLSLSLDYTCLHV